MVPREIYEAIVETAHAEGRTISGPLRAIAGNFLAMARAEVSSFRLAVLRRRVMFRQTGRWGNLPPFFFCSDGLLGRQLRD